jgi:hypothetical protein
MGTIGRTVADSAVVRWTGISLRRREPRPADSSFFRSPRRGTGVSAETYSRLESTALWRHEDELATRMKVNHGIEGDLPTGSKDCSPPLRGPSREERPSSSSLPRADGTRPASEPAGLSRAVPGVPGLVVYPEGISFADSQRLLAFSSARTKNGARTAIRFPAQGLRAVASGVSALVVRGAFVATVRRSDE